MLVVMQKGESTSILLPIRGGETAPLAVEAREEVEELWTIRIVGSVPAREGRRARATPGAGEGMCGEGGRSSSTPMLSSCSGWEWTMGGAADRLEEWEEEEREPCWDRLRKDLKDLAVDLEREVDVAVVKQKENVV